MASSLAFKEDYYGDHNTGRSKYRELNFYNYYLSRGIDSHRRIDLFYSAWKNHAASGKGEGGPTCLAAATTSAAGSVVKSGKISLLLTWWCRGDR